MLSWGRTFAWQAWPWPATEAERETEDKAAGARRANLRGIFV